MNTRDYLTKILTHLKDRNTYKPLTYNPTSTIVNDAYTLIEYMHSQHIIAKVTIEFLLPPKAARTPLFYELPKTHKPGCLLRPMFLVVMVQLTFSLPASHQRSHPHADYLGSSVMHF